MLSAFRALSWRTRQTLRLTVAVWMLGSVQFATVLAVWARGMPPAWSASFLAMAVIAGLACSGLLYLLSRGLERRGVKVRWPILGLAVACVALSQSVIDHTAFRIAQGKIDLPVTYADVAGMVLNLQIYVWLYGLYVVALELLRTIESERTRMGQLTEAREAAQEAKLEALRFQLNPHFLFNTLNAISGLVIKNRNAEAETMIGKLANFLRTTFDTDPKELISLADELATIEAYLDIESVRFGERLHATVDCPEPLLEAKAPSFILQPLVENAVKYAVAPSRDGATIKVTASAWGGDLILVVEDTGRSSGARPANGTGVGLENTRARLATLFGAAGSLETSASETGFVAKVRMPLRLDLEPVD